MRLRATVSIIILIYTSSLGFAQEKAKRSCDFIEVNSKIDIGDYYAEDAWSYGITYTRRSFHWISSRPMVSLNKTTKITTNYSGVNVYDGLTLKTGLNFNLQATSFLNIHSKITSGIGRESLRNTNWEAAYYPALDLSTGLSFNLWRLQLNLQVGVDNINENYDEGPDVSPYYQISMGYLFNNVTTLKAYKERPKLKKRNPTLDKEIALGFGLDRIYNYDYNETISESKKLESNSWNFCADYWKKTHNFFLHTSIFCRYKDYDNEEWVNIPDKTIANKEYYSYSNSQNGKMFLSGYSNGIEWREVLGPIALCFGLDASVALNYSDNSGSYTLYHTLRDSNGIKNNLRTKQLIDKYHGIEKIRMGCYPEASFGIRFTPYKRISFACYTSAYFGIFGGAERDRYGWWNYSQYSNSLGSNGGYRPFPMKYSLTYHFGRNIKD